MSDAVAQQAEGQEPVIDLSLADSVIDKYIDLPGNLMPVLQGCQDVYGYIPRVVADHIAERLNVYPSQIYGVLTFYAQFHLKPRGKFIVRICVGTACHVLGAPRIVEAFFDKLQIRHAETTPDLRFTMEEVACLGACGMAPLAMVNDSTYGAMTIQKVDQIVDDYSQRPM